MKILDRYVAKNFLIGYAIAFAVLIGLRVIIDLFVEIDEFVENLGDLGTAAVMKHILTFYGLNCTLYFRDFAGMITVVAASFSFGRMVRSNELVAVMASGVSLKRIIGPIVFLALLLTGVLVIDQELIIPRLADKLVRSHDDVPGQESYDVRFVGDGNGSLICAQRFDVETSMLYKPTILLRRPVNTGIWEVTARIDAGKALYNDRTRQWDLYSRDPNDPNGTEWNTYADDPNEGRWLPFGLLFEKNAAGKPRAIASYASDITARDIPVMCKSEHKTLLGLKQLNELAKQGTQVRDLAQLYSQKHFRITDPIINLVMLMISLPLLVCRDPKSMKSAVTIAFALTGACFITTFVCKILATEFVFDKVIPELWAWLPVFVFLPVAFIELDAMKT